MDLSAKKVGLALLAVVVVGILSLGILAVVVTGNLLTNQDSPAGNIAVIEISGPIVSGGGGSLPWRSGQTSARKVMSYINQAKESQKIKAILLRVNSPGGSSAAADAIYQELKKFKQTERPIVASMGGMAASGGYYVSCLADKIYANPATITGSIGVIMKFRNLKGLYNKLGIKQVILKSGKYKDLGSPSQEMTEQEKEILTGMMKDVYNRFIKVVAKGRDIKRSQVKELATGRIYNGKQAKKLNLIDQLGTYYDAIEATAQLAGIKGEPDLIHYGQPSPLQRLLSSVNQLVMTLLGNHINSTQLQVKEIGNYRSEFLYYQLLHQGKYKNLKLQY